MIKTTKTFARHLRLMRWRVRRASRQMDRAVWMGIRQAAHMTGLLRRLEAQAGPRTLWLRSVLAKADFDDLVRLDMPWWTFDAVREVEAFLHSRRDARVFEWGAGASTLWLAKRAGEVVSITHDGPDYDRVLDRLDTFAPVTLRHVPAQDAGLVGSKRRGFTGQRFDRYVRAIHDVEGEFDLIVIDGRAREACLEEAKARLAPGGVILFDDFKRRRYRSAVADSGLKVHRFDGLAVRLALPDSTVLLSRV
ncbi:class I SAM-dependent methyltransferase [Pseudooceanicola sp. MF1-13]|uniref:class I SAM-dependent methyltransferase n=1 Tax=Pseudooceanicola sp. MF1-13 TaxID=3379095 RepID=UPI0038918FFC